jgi:hypothetical protein
MRKYLVTIEFEMSEELMSNVPKHREVIDEFINTGFIDFYTVSLETSQSWILINAATKDEATEILKASPLFDFWKYTIAELFVYDSVHFRLPELSLN